MVKNKHSSLLTLESIIWLLLILLIVFSVGSCVVRQWKTQNKALESYNLLIDQIREFKNNEAHEIILYLKDESVIIGFGKTSEKFEYIDEQGKVVSFFKRPTICKKGSSCVCICNSNFQYKMYDKEAECLGEMICTPSENGELSMPDIADKIKVPHIDKEKLGYTKDMGGNWSGGFIIPGEGAKFGLSYSGIEPQQKKTIWIEKYNDVVAICDNGPCLTPEERNEIEKQENEEISEEQKKKAVEVFKNFENFYKECENKQGECGYFESELTKNYYIYYNHDQTTDQFGFYLLEGAAGKSFQDMKKVLENDKELFYGGMLFTKNQQEIENGDIFRGISKIKLSNLQGYLVIEWSE